MASLKELRDRINSVKATQKITKAMQMVAASKLRRAQAAAEQARPYSEHIETIYNIMARDSDPTSLPAMMQGNGRDKKHLLVICTADRGLCGGFNSQIARFAKSMIEKLQKDGKDVSILAVGRKGAEILRRDYKDLFIDEISFRDDVNAHKGAILFPWLMENLNSLDPSN